MAISIIRTIILYTVMVISMRIMGKRQLGELEPEELVVALLISELAVNPMQDIGTPLSYGLVPVFTLIFCEVMMSGAALKFRKIRRVISGHPSILIEHGKLDRNEMKKNRFTIDELLEHLRKGGVIDISTVKYAILETDGNLSILLYDNDAPATPKQLGIKADEPSMQFTIISDGEIIEPNLYMLGFNEKWLRKQLRAQGFRQAKEVFLMTADRDSNVYVTGKE